MTAGRRSGVVGDEPGAPRRVDARAFRTRAELRAGMRRAREGAYRSGHDRLRLDDIARDTKALANADPSSFLPAPKATVSGWLQDDGPLPRITETRPFRAFLRACGVPAAELAEWVDALGRVQEAVSSEPEPAEPAPAAPEPVPAAPPDSEPVRADPRPTAGDVEPPALPRVRCALGVAAALLGVLIGILAAARGASGIAPCPPVLGIGELLLLLGPWAQARLRHDPGVDLDDTLARWSTDLQARWETELEGRRWIEPHLRVGWHVHVPDERAWAEQVAAARGPGPGPGGSWPRPDRIAGHDDALADALLTRLPTRRLLLVGRSGAGKSVLLLHLAIRLSAAAAERGSPYPALLPLATWDRGDPLEVWLARRLTLDDPRLGRRARGSRHPVAVEALRAGRLIPVLDGLDEIGDEAQRVDALTRIGDWLRRAPRPGLVVATRPMPEGHPPAPPRLTPVGHVEPLPTATARDYLTEHAGGPVWHEVLPDDPAHPVVRALRRPLGVWLAAAVHQGSGPDPRALRTPPDERGVLRYLIGLFLPAAYARPPRPGWTSARAERWLRTVAAFTTGAGGRDADLVWWELWRRARRPVLALLALPGALAVGLVAGLDHRLGMGLGCGILAGIGAAVAVRRLRRAVPQTGDFGPGITFGFVGALVGAVLGGVLVVRTGLDDTPWRGIVGALGAGIAAGGVARYRPAAVVGGFVGGLVVPLTANAGVGLVAGVLDGLGAWAAGAMVIGGTRGLPARRLSRPNPWVVLGVAVPCGLAIGTRATAVHGLATGVVAGVLVGVLGGVAAGATAAPVQVSGFSADPRDVLRDDRRTFWTMLPLGGLAFGTGAAVTVNPWVGAAAFVIVGLGSAATRTAYAPFVVARCWFAASRRLPLRLTAFLEDAHAKGVLRQNGAGYQVRHLELAEYLRVTPRR